MAFTIKRAAREDFDLGYYLGTKARLEEAKRDFAEAERKMIEAMDGAKSRNINNHHVTVVQRETTKVDENKLKKIVGAPLFNKMTKKVFDRTKLESMISMGEVSVDQVASASEIVPSKPYLRITQRAEEEAVDQEPSLDGPVPG